MGSISPPANGGTPGGPAGGDLGGTYPDPVVNQSSAPAGFVAENGVQITGNTPAGLTNPGITRVNQSIFINAASPGGQIYFRPQGPESGSFQGFISSTGVMNMEGFVAFNAGVSTPAVVSGTAFTPAALYDTMVYMQLNAAAAGSYTLTMGPTTGAEHTIANAVAMVIGSDALVTLRVPATWKVVLTATTVTIGTVTVVTC